MVRFRILLFSYLAIDTSLYVVSIYFLMAFISFPGPIKLAGVSLFITPLLPYKTFSRNILLRLLSTAIGLVAFGFLSWKFAHNYGLPSLLFAAMLWSGIAGIVCNFGSNKWPNVFPNYYLRAQKRALDATSKKHL